MARSTDSNGLAARSVRVSCRPDEAAPKPGPARRAARPAESTRRSASRRAESAIDERLVERQHRPHISSVVAASVRETLDVVTRAGPIHLGAWTRGTVSGRRRSFGTAICGSVGDHLDLPPVGQRGRDAGTRDRHPERQLGALVDSRDGVPPAGDPDDLAGRSASSSARPDVRRTMSLREATPPRTGIRRAISIVRQPRPLRDRCCALHRPRPTDRTAGVGGRPAGVDRASGRSVRTSALRSATVQVERPGRRWRPS